MFRPIIQAPDPRLLQPSAPVGLFMPISGLIGDLISTRLEAGAAGLSAVQIGVHLRVVATHPMEFFGFKVLINPEIVARSDEMVTQDEGCMSIDRGKRLVPVARHKFVQLHFLDRKGEAHDIRAEGFAARLIQHEIGHLDGKLIA